MADSNPRAAKRAVAREARWREVATKADLKPEVKVRSRRLAGGAADDAALQHNAWDDIEWTAAEVAAAEAVIGSQSSRAPPDASSTGALAWDGHYNVNLRNYNDRHYLHNDFPYLLPAARETDEPVTILETGCGAGNSLLPLLASDPSASMVGCDVSPRAVALVSERIAREGLAHRASASVWDLAQPPPESLPPLPFAHLTLAIFTLSALPPASMVDALRHLRACLRPGGRILLRDYGRLDSKQLKFARAAGARLECGVPACEWYARGDGTTVVFFSEALLRNLATAAGLEVERCNLDKRLVVNRASGARMQRVWIVAVLRVPSTRTEGLPPTSITPLREAPPTDTRGLFYSAPAAAADERTSTGQGGVGGLARWRWRSRLRLPRSIVSFFGSLVAVAGALAGVAAWRFTQKRALLRG